MGVRFACPACSHRLNVKSELAGRRGKCPECGARFRVPVADQPVAAPLEAADSGSSSAVDVERQPANAPGSAARVAGAAAAVGAGAAVRADAESAMPPQQLADGRRSAAPTNPLDAAPGASWYVRPQTGGQYGPADAATMRQWLAEHRIGPHSLVWRDGWTAWRPAAEVFVELAPPEESVAATVVVPAVGQSVADRPNPGQAKYRRAQKQTTIVAILVGVAVLLVIALAVALLWPRGADDETARYGGPGEPLHSFRIRT